MFKKALKTSGVPNPNFANKKTTKWCHKIDFACNCQINKSMSKLRKCV